MGTLAGGLSRFHILIIGRDCRIIRNFLGSPPQCSRHTILLLNNVPLEAIHPAFNPFALFRAYVSINRRTFGYFSKI